MPVPLTIVPAPGAITGPREIPLTRGHVALVDADDYEDLAQYKWHAQRCRRTFYARRSKTIQGRKYLISMHRVVMKAPDGQDVDHRDGNTLNNQRTNLRFATNSQNQANRVRLATNTSGRRGVTWHKRARRWQAAIGRNGKRIYIGFFTDVDTAARAYDAAARELFGEFARLNFPEEGS